jgi:hypothetical protein
LILAAPNIHPFDVIHAHDSIMPSKAIVRSKSKAIAVKRQAKNNLAKDNPAKNNQEQPGEE